MEAIRIKLTQNTANYKRKEVIDNKMTYPLPPFSTIIGALHYCCGYTEYHPMDISIQGDFRTMTKEAYTDHCFLNNLQNDRGILVKMYNPDNLSKGYQRVGYAMKSQGNDFRKGITVMIENQELIKEYRDLKDLSDNIDAFKKGRYKKFQDTIKRRKATLKEKKKNLDKKSDDYKKIDAKLNYITDIEKNAKERLSKFETENYSLPFSKFKTLTTSLKFYEVLHQVELIIHIKTDENTMNDIINNIYNMKGLGRSEDFVQIQECKKVILEEVDNEYTNKFHSYIDAKLIEDEETNSFCIKTNDKGIKRFGTKYFMPKNYVIKDKKRIFSRKKVYYTSNYTVSRNTSGVFIDKTDMTTEKDKENAFIVNFL